MTRQSDKTGQQQQPHRALGLLPFIGVALFAVSAIAILAGDRSGDWQRALLLSAVVYMIGWAGIGAGVSHIFFGKKISASIGWAPSPFEFEVGCANLGFGIAGVLAGSFSSDYWLAVIIASSIFRVGAGIGHIRQMIFHDDFAVNNSAILFLNFVVPAFLFFAYFAWA